MIDQYQENSPIQHEALHKKHNLYNHVRITHPQINEPDEWVEMCLEEKTQEKQPCIYPSTDDLTHHTV